MLALERPGEPLDEETKRSVYRAAAQAPLAEEPFIIAGIESLLAEKDQAAERLLEEARRRNPRSPVPRLLLLTLYGQAKRTSDAATELTVLARLIPGAGAIVVPELLRLAETAEGRKAVADVLRSDRAFRGTVLEHLVTQGGDPDLIVELAGGIPEPSPGEEAPAWQGLLLGALVERGEVHRAHTLWSRFSGLKAAPQGVHDGNFRDPSGIPPFSWNFTQSADGLAEPARGNGLQVEYYGRTDMVLAEQLLTLAPGSRFRLSFETGSLVGESDGSLGWRLTCLGESQHLAELPIKVETQSRLFSADFAVPERCSAQWLRLVGTSSEVPKEQSTLIRNLQIIQAPAR